MSKRDVEAIYPLTPQQQGMLFESVAAPGSGINIEQWSATLTGPLDAEVFRGAWKKVVERHPVLRTGFVWKERDEPLQVVLPRVEVPWTEEDLSPLPAAEREERLAAYRERDRRRDFTLGKAPLMRLALFRLGPEEHAFVWTQHHILMDGWCLGLVFREILALYEAGLAGRDAALPSPRPYRDFVSWLRGRDHAEAEEFWRRTLEGFSRPTALGRGPDGGEVSGKATGEGHAEREIRLPAEPSAALRAAAAGNRLTLNTLVQGVWALLLARYSGDDDVVFGVTVSGRPAELAGIEETIGLFINTLPVRVRVERGETLGSMLARLQRFNVELRGHEHTPGLEVRRWGEVPASLPLYESLVVFENLPGGGGEGDGPEPPIRVETPSSAGGQTAFPLTLRVSLGEQLVAHLTHDRRRVSDAGAEAVAGHLADLLGVLPASLDTEVGSLLDRVPEEEIPSVRPRPGAGKRSSAAPLVAPRTPVEEILVGIWQQVLGIGVLGVEDHFFELGGHSLFATELVGRVRDAFDIQLPLRHLFEAPTVAGLARRVKSLLGEGGTSAPVLPELAPDPASRHEPFPLTDIQHAYWIGRSAAFELGGVATHSYQEVDTTELDVDRFEAAWRSLVERHDMLRAIVESDGRQRVLPEVPPYEIERVDLRGADPGEVAAELAALREEMSHQVIPADRWPLFDLRAAILDGDRVRLHISFDLLIGDGRSFDILTRELITLYRDPDAVLPPLEVTFRDYVTTTAALEGSEIYETSRAYWMERLPNLPSAPRLPLAGNPAALARPRFVRRRGELDRERWQRLKDRAVRAGLTPSAVLVSAYADVLGRWSRGPRFLLNLTLFNRLPLHPQVSELVGDFTSLTLLEVDTGGDGGFESRTRALQSRLWEDLDHGHFSGVRVLRELARQEGGPPRAVAPVVFTSALVLSSLEPEPPPLDSDPGSDGGNAGGAGFNTSFAIGQTPQVWLDQQVSEEAGRLSYNWDAVEELFPPGILDEMITAYGDLLERLAEDDRAWETPGRPELPEDQRALRETLNDTAAPLTDQLLHDLFGESAREHPEAVALVDAGGERTYGELDRRVDALARRLREAGVRPPADGDSELVAVVMEKGWEQAAATLAVLRAGGAYLPVDARLPEARLLQLLDRGGVRLALTQPRFLDRLPWPEGVSALVVDDGQISEDAEGGEGAEATAGAGAGNPEDTAYVIFTSGSTGEPKGVVLDHRGPVNTLLDVNRRFGVGPEDRTLALSALNFDLSVYDLFGLFAAGGAVVFPEPDADRDPERWGELVESAGVTVWNSVPALAEMMAEHEEARSRSRLESLRLFLLSGDWIPPTLPDRLRRLAPGARVISLGGATEASVWSILHPVDEVDATWTSIPYGRPMDNQTFHVLDEALEPCPVWVTGQLYIGGVGLAKGYHRDPERTAAAFIEHPATGERLYRTGDLGRLRPEGWIEILGREDLQVKVQGHRIELGEVETVLCRHPGVESVVAAVVGPKRGAGRLVAYVVPARRRGEGEGAAGGEEACAPSSQPASGGGLAWPEGAPPPAPELPEHRLTPEDAAAFAAALPALRRDLGDRPAVDLPAAEPAPAPAGALFGPFFDEGAEGAPGARPSKAEEPAPALGRLLAALAQVEIEGAPLPKYRYPSAGSLYPVQAYTAAAGKGELSYYHPREHRLYPLQGSMPGGLAVAIGDAPSALLLVVDRAAIDPLYGRDGRDLSVLEAGYIEQLLRAEAGPLGLRLTRAPLAAPELAAALEGSPILAGGREPLALLLVDGRSDDELLEDAAVQARPAPAADSGLRLPEGELPEVPAAVKGDPVSELSFKLAQPGVRRDGFSGPGVPLPAPEADAAWAASYLRRESHRDFEGGTLDLAELGGLLACLRPLRRAESGAEGAPGGTLAHRYPSRDGLFPVETYLHVKPDRVAGLPEGTYYYRPWDHRLVLLSAAAPLDREQHGEINRPIFDGAAVSLFLLVDLKVATPVHGEAAWEEGLLEAGAMGQLLMTEAPARRLGLCPIGGLDFDPLRRHLALSPEHRLLHSFLLGRPPESPAVGGAEAAELLEELRAHAAERLPAYMVPSAFVPLAALPLTANGKVDRKALPDPDAGKAEAGAPFEAASTDLERSIVEAWSAVLDVERVGRNDGFFELGGDSVKMIQVHNRLAEALERKVAITELFRHPTPRTLAEFLDSDGGDEEEAAALEEDRERGRGRLEARRRRRRRRGGSGGTETTDTSDTSETSETGEQD